jgi:hypothetical protein
VAPRADNVEFSGIRADRASRFMASGAGPPRAATPASATAPKQDDKHAEEPVAADCRRLTRTNVRTTISLA